MRKFLIWTLFLALVPFTGSLKAQAAFSVISVTANPDTLIINTASGDTLIRYAIRIANLGVDDYNGPLIIYGKYEHAAGIRYCTGSNFYTPHNTFAVNDTLTFYYDDIVLPTSKVYKGGGNIIVVWPKADGAQVMDSGSVNVYVDGIVNIDRSKEMVARINVFPNPASGTLNFAYRVTERELDFVCMFDMFGREVFHSVSMVDKLDISGFSPGMYVVIVRFKDGIKGQFKIIVQ